MMQQSNTIVNAPLPPYSSVFFIPRCTCSCFFFVFPAFPLVLFMCPPYPLLGLTSSVHHESVQQFVLGSSAIRYFEDLAHFVRQQSFTLDRLVRNAEQ